MTTAIDWIKARTTTKTDEPLIVDGVLFDVEIDFFAGHLPRQMVRAASKAALEYTETSERVVNEVLAVHVKSGFAEYSRTTYTAAA